ncbi:MAG: hypothetical protein RQ899_15065 [Pseudomonadales bacterium]|nr:hypothetical protein [Pseudomonadales bacterium]
MNFKEAVDVSEVIVRGYIDSVSDGRFIRYRNAPVIPPMQTSLIKIEVSKVLKGNPGKYVYFEYATGGNARELDDNKYPGEILVFLRPDDRSESSYLIENSANGLMHEVDKLYRLTLQSRLFIMEADVHGRKMLFSPLSEEGAALLSSPAKLDTFEDIEREVAAAMAEPNSRQ